MKIIAVKDILLDYFMTPFCTHSVHEAIGGIAAVINNPENQDAISKSPSQFQIWLLGEVDPEGAVTARRELLASCHSLVRPVERPPTEDPRQQELRLAYNERRSPQNGATDKPVPDTDVVVERLRNALRPE